MRAAAGEKRSTRSGSTWQQQGEKLVGFGQLGPADLGSSVALCGDAKTALLGGPQDKFPGRQIFARAPDRRVLAHRAASGAGDACP